MFIRNLLLIFLAMSGLAVPPGFAETPVILAHLNPIEVDAELNFSDLVDATLEFYPDSTWLNTLEEEAKAIAQRSESWFAGSPTLVLAYQEASSGTLHIGDAVIGTPLWNFGQRDAEKALAQQTQKSAQSQKDLTKLTVTGLLRTALWNMSLMNIRHEQARLDYETSQRLVTEIKKRYKLGEMAKSDLLLVQGELLQKQLTLVQAGAEVMRARKLYISITQSNIVPAHFDESLFGLSKIEQNHPGLQAINSLIDRKRAEIDAIRLTGSGQNKLWVGVNSDHGDSRSNHTESFNITLEIPFGGDAHLAPKIAAAHVALNKLIAQRTQISRDLNRMHQEAEQNLQVNRAELEIANELKQVAEHNMKITEVKFSVGEIDLIDFLKIQSTTQRAILNAKLHSITRQRNIALYNQSVGAMP